MERPLAWKWISAVNMRADVIAGGDDLAVGTLPHVRSGDPLEVLNPQGHIAGPRGGVNGQTLSQVKHFDLVHEL